MGLKKAACLLLASSMLMVTLGGCLKDSSQQSATVQVDYNAEEEVAKYKDHLGELSEADKNYVVQLGYNNCDHMVASLVGEGSGIFDALGLNVNITKTGQIMQAMASGEMDVGYQGIVGAINSVNNGAPLFMAAANHLGGSYYLVVDNDKDSNDLDNWGVCCVYAMSNNFKEEHPELAKRLVLAHALSVKYIYQHPYNAAMIFADAFGTKPEAALNTIYMKTVKEGRTLTWQFSEKNLENLIANWNQYDTIPEEDRLKIDDLHKFMSTDLIEECGVEDFHEFIKNEVEPLYPTGISFEDWLKKAKEIDGITSTEYDDAANIMMND